MREYQQIRCLHCTKDLRVRVEYLGHKLTCKICGQGFRAPTQSELSLQARAADLEAQLAALRGEDLGLLKLERDRALQEAAGASVRIEGILVELEQARAQLRSHQEAHAQARAEQERLEGLAANLEHRLHGVQDAPQDVARLTREKELWRHERDFLADDLESLRRELANAQRELTLAQQALVQRERERELWRTERDFLTDDLDKAGGLQAQLYAASEALIAKDREWADALLRVEAEMAQVRQALQVEVEGLRAQAARHAAELRHREEAVQDLLRDRDSARQAQAELMANLIQSREERDRLSEHVSTLGMQLQTLQSERERLIGQDRQWQERVGQLEAQVAALRQSAGRSGERDGTDDQVRRELVQAQEQIEQLRGMLQGSGIYVG